MDSPTERTRQKGVVGIDAVSANRTCEVGRHDTGNGATQGSVYALLEFCVVVVAFTRCGLIVQQGQERLHYFPLVLHSPISHEGPQLLWFADNLDYKF
jgi:hypothetical protein